MKYFVCFLSLLLLCNDVVFAEVACIVSYVSGGVDLVDEFGTDKQKLLLFKKLRPGDIIVLSANSKLNLKYLNEGLLESWEGPVTIIVKSDKAFDKFGNLTPCVSSLDDLTAELHGSSTLNNELIFTKGVLPIRSSHEYFNIELSEQQKAKLSKIENKCSFLKSSRSDFDMIADIYYIAALENLGQKATAAKHITWLLSKGGANDYLIDLLNNL